MEPRARPRRRAVAGRRSRRVIGVTPKNRKTSEEIISRSVLLPREDHITATISISIRRFPSLRGESSRTSAMDATILGCDPTAFCNQIEVS